MCVLVLSTDHGKNFSPKYLKTLWLDGIIERKVLNLKFENKIYSFNYSPRSEAHFLENKEQSS